MLFLLNIRADALYTIVTMELRRLSEYLKNDEDRFAEILARKSDKDYQTAHETEGVGKNRTQRVVIYYRFVGYLEIPNEQTHFSEDTRQGVSVEYISCAPIKVRYGDDGEECEEGG